MKTRDSNQSLVYGILFIVLCICIWVGWSDHDFIKPTVSQEEIRESIRHYVRTAFQISVQFVIPIAILGYFGKKLLSRKIRS